MHGHSEVAISTHNFPNCFHYYKKINDRIINTWSFIRFLVQVKLLPALPECCLYQHSLHNNFCNCKKTINARHYYLPGVRADWPGVWTGGHPLHIIIAMSYSDEVLSKGKSQKLCQDLLSRAKHLYTQILPFTIFSGLWFSFSLVPTLMPNTPTSDLMESHISLASLGDQGMFVNSNHSGLIRWKRCWSELAMCVRGLME